MQPLPPVSSHLDESIQNAIDSKTKPLGALGQLERLAARICRVQGTLRPSMEQCRLFIFAADHGIAAEGVSAYPQAVTGQMVLNFLGGGAAANVFASVNGAELTVVDAGIAGDAIEHPQLLSHRIGPGTKNFLREAAMSEAELDRALQTGWQLGQAADGQALACGEMGIANTSSATLLAHKLTGVPLATLAGPGTGLDDEGLRRKVAVLEQAAARTDVQLDAREAMREYGGFEIAMMAGAMLGAASAGRVVLVDGFIATAAALCASRLAESLDEYLVFAHQSAEPGHQAMLRALNAEPLLDLSLRLGEGTGALLAWPLLRSAAAMMNDMASFESAGVSGPAPE